MITTRKGMNCSKNNIEPQELPHIVIRKRQMEEEQELNNTQLSFATILTHKPKKNKNFCPMHQTKKYNSLKNG
jgi:hypothetical protein